MEGTSTRTGETADGDSGDPPIVELVEVTKSFPGVRANDRVSLTVRAGEAHCLLGENGAGKSTLMSILAGMIQPDSGTIRVDGEPVTIDSPRASIELGIGMVYQHSTLVEPMTVLENLMLGEPRLRLDRHAARERFEELSATIGADIDPDAAVAALALGQRQQVEIVKALWRGSRVLILDEPTSMLTPQGVTLLEERLVRLKATGMGIVFITHKLGEALSLGDRVSVLRRGRMVQTLTPGDDGQRAEELQDRIVELMFGEQADAAMLEPELGEGVTTVAERRDIADEAVLVLDGVSVEGGESSPGLHELALSAHRGEILGVAGVDGNGQRELAEVIAGQIRASAGTIAFCGAPIDRLGIAGRQRLGIRYVTDDRLGEGTVAPMSLAINLLLKRIGQAPFWRRGQIQTRAVQRNAQELVDEFDIRTPGTETRIGTLSGGNIQKALLARELSFDPVIVVYNKPTYGLDLKTTLAVRRRIRDQAQAGTTAIVISTDLEELLEISDRIAVLHHGRLAGMTDNGPGAAAQAGAWMIGATAP